MIIAGFTNSHGIRFVALRTSKKPLEGNSNEVKEDRSDAKHRKGNWRNQSEALVKKRYSIPLTV